jgi:hypothetical protein
MHTLIVYFAIALNVVAYYPYLRDMFRRIAQPHAYTWLIWTLTQGTGALASWKGGGGWAAVIIGVGALLCLLIFLLSLRYGTRNITRGDTIVLIGALAAIYVWWGLSQPLLAVVMVSTIDGVGYWPTWRKTYKEPQSETLAFWIAMVTTSTLIIITTESWNLLTLLYPIVQVLANTGVVAAILLGRRKDVRSGIRV